MADQLVDSLAVADPEKEDTDVGQALESKPAPKKTPTRKPATPKAAAAKVEAANVEVEPKAEPKIVPEPRGNVGIVQEIEDDVKTIAEKAKQAMESEASKVEETVDEEVSALKRLTVPELRQMHQDALKLESEAKRELYMLRLRFANAATTIDDAAERELAVGRIRAEEAAVWVGKLEQALKGEYKDLVGVAKFGGRH